MTCGVILSCYNNWDIARRSLKALAAQSRLPDEVAIADDGSRPPADAAIFRQPFTVHHVWHPDEGNRKPCMLNRAAAQLSSDCLVFVDADCLPHPRFVEDHLALLAAHPGSYIQGSRAEVALASVPAFRPRLWTVLRYVVAGKMVSRIKAFRFPRAARRWVWGGPFYPCGSNLSCRRIDFIAVNGYDETFSGYGNEDNDLCYRLQAAGIQPVEANGCCILFHLEHQVLRRSAANEARLAEKLRSGKPSCQVGYAGTCERPPRPTVTTHPPLP